MSASKRQHRPTAAEDRVPMKEIWGFALGGFATGGAVGIASQLITFIYVFTLGVSPWILSLVLSVNGIIGIISGPFVGQFCDNYRSRWGRRRPLILFSGVPAVLLASLVYFVPSGLSDVKMALWLLLIIVPMNLLNSIFMTSLGALCVESTTDYHERARLSQFLTTFALVVALMVQWVFPAAKLHIFGSTMHGIHMVVGFLSVFFFIACFAPLFCSEKRYAAIANKPVSNNVLANMKEAITNIGDVSKNRPFVVLVIIVTITVFCYSIVGGLGTYMNSYFVCGGDQNKAAYIYGWLGSSYCIAGGLAVAFLYPFIVRRWGKKASLQAAAAILMVDCLSKLVVYNPKYPFLQVVVLAANGISFQGIMFTMGSMMGDIINFDELVTGKRREAIYGALMGWVQGIGITIAGVLSGFILKWIGFNSKISVQSVHTLICMKYLYFLFPFIGALFAIYMSRRYDLTEDRVYEIRDALKKREADEKAEMEQAPLA